MASLIPQIDPRTGQVYFLPQEAPVPTSALLGMDQFAAPVPQFAPMPTGLPPLPGPVGPAGTGFAMPNSFWPTPQPYATEGVQAPQMQPLGPEAATRVPPAAMQQQPQPQPQAAPAPAPVPPPPVSPAPPIPTTLPTLQVPPPPPEAVNIGMVGTAQAPSPPSNPEEVAAAESAWDQFLQQLTNPGFNNLLLQMGLQLLQPRPMGQSPAGHVATAAQGALTSQVGLAQQQAQRELAKSKFGLEKRRVEAEETRVGHEGQRVEQEGKRVAQGERGLDIESRRADIAKTEAESAASYRRGQLANESTRLSIERGKAASQDAVNKASIALKKAEAKLKDKEASAAATTGGAKLSAKHEYARAIAQAYVDTGKAKTLAQALVMVHEDEQKPEELRAKLLETMVGVEGGYAPEETLSSVEFFVNGFKQSVLQDRLSKVGATPEKIEAEAKRLGMTPEAIRDDLSRKLGLQ